MAAYTSAQAGNWSDDATWTGTGVPGNGDTVTMTHAITVDTNTTVGASPLGKPPVAPTASASTGSATTFLPTGTYRIAYSFVTAGGESCMSAEITLAVTRGTSKPRVTLPALPSGVTSISLYLSAAGGAAGSETRFCTGITGTTIDLIGADDGATGSYWENAQGGDGNDAVGGAVARASAAAPQAVPAAAILLNSTSAVLTIATGVTLTVRGDCVKAANTAGIVMNAGSHFQWDASACATPAAGFYCGKPDTAGRSGVFLKTNGSSGSHCTVTSVTTGGAAPGYFTDDGNTASGQMDHAFADISYIGAATYDAFRYWISGSGNTFSLVDCTVDHCGRFLQDGSSNAAAIQRYQRTKFTNSLGSSCIQFGGILPTTGVQLVDLCVFDKDVNFFSAAGMTITSNAFLNGHDATAGLPVLYQGNFVYTGQVNISWYGDISKSYLVHTAATNPNCWAMKSTTANQTFDGIICQSSGAATVGDFIFPGPSAAFTWTIQNCILLPNTNNQSPGKLVSCAGFTGTYAGTIVCNHNTACSTDAHTNVETGVLNYGESGAGKAGMISSFQSNIAWTPATKNAGALYYHYTSAVQDACAAANADYNGKSGLTASGVGSGNNGVGYVSQDATAPFTGSPGAHDVSADPQYVDPTRNLQTWGTMKGADGTVAGALALIAADPSLIYSASDMTTLWQWVRGGWAPTNPAYKGTAHDGGDIGAVPVVLLAGSPVIGSGVVRPCVLDSRVVRAAS